MTKPNKKSLAKLREDVIKEAERYVKGHKIMPHCKCRACKIARACAALAERTRK